MKKSLVLALVAVLVLSFASMAFAFTDTDSHWAKAYINKLVDVKVVNGATATTFVPDGKVTRAEFAKMIVNAKGLALENPATATFSDVAVTAWYFPYIEAAAKAGLVSGTGNGKFAPTANVTRQEVAKMIVLAAGLKADATKALNFDDKASISDWAKGFVAVAADAKLVQGYNNKFSPVANATRAEAAKLVYSEMLYEGKITAVVAEVPAGSYKVTDTPVDNLSIELNDDSYDIASNVTMQIAGEYVDDARLFVEGTLVKITLRDDKVISLVADGNVTKGEVTETGTNTDGDDTVTINGKDYVINSTDFIAYTIDGTDKTITNFVVGSNYKLLLNADGEIYAAFDVDAETKTGEVTGKGTTSDDKFYISIANVKYYTEKDVTNVDSKVTVKINGQFSTWSAIKSGDMVADVELNSKGELFKVTAWDKEIQGTVSGITYGDGTTKYYFVDADGDKWTNIRTVSGSTYFIAEKAIGVGSTWTQVTASSTGIATLVSSNLRPVLSSVKVKIDGSTTNNDYSDLSASDKVRLTLNTDGEVTLIEVIDNSAIGQIESFTEDTHGDVTAVKVGGVNYTLADKIDNKDNVIFKGLLIDAAINADNELDLVGQFKNLVENSDEEIVLYNVIATPFEKGRPTDAEVASHITDDTYAPGGKIRIMDEDGVVSEVTVNGINQVIVKANDDVKITNIKKGDIVAFNADKTYIMVNPISAVH